MQFNYLNKFNDLIFDKILKTLVFLFFGHNIYQQIFLKNCPLKASCKVKTLLTLIYEFKDQIINLNS